MKKQQFQFVSLLMTIIFAGSCKDIIEENLSKSMITIVAPANNVSSSVATQFFKWEEVEGAETYQLQIVKPDFDSITQFILDTTIKTTQYSYVLQSGVYQWRVRAKNNTSNTDYVVHNLIIDSSLNLASDKVPLSTPADNSFSKRLTNTFRWQTLPNASYYTFRVFLNGTPIFSRDTTATTINYAFASEDTYQWNVLAYNSSSNSTSNGGSPYTITIDTTTPVAPNPTYLPLNDTTSQNPVPITWSSAEAHATYQLLISKDSTFVNTGQTVKDTITSSLFYNFYNPTATLHYFWKVRAIDAAANVGGYSVSKKFIPH
jgi:hypothetical protein